MPKKRLLIFLSHASEDKPMVRKLCKQLLDDGFDPWLDENRLLPGQDWNFEIELALRNSDSILLCFSSQSSIKEGYIQREYKKAMDYQLEKPEGSIFVIPVRLDKCEIPFFLRELQYVDYPSGYEKLALSLNMRAGKASNKRKPSKSAVSNRDITKAVRSKENIRQVQLVLEGAFEEFNETRQEDLVSVLASILRVDSESIRILQVYSGSIIVVVEMPGAVADRLVELAEKRDLRLKSQGILSIKVDNESEISLSFTDQEPMLRNILENAVNILNCQAGVLFLMDELTGDLIFSMIMGPVANDLLGQRLRLGTGVAGRAAQSRVPVIENDALRSASDLVGHDKQTGFVSRSLLAVPIQFRGRVLGVVEVINRRDDQPFVEGDRNLLNAFASQAAFGIENARLLTIADKELANTYREVQHANLAKSDFVAFVAHEVRNPVASVKGYTELLAAGSVGQVNEMQTNFLNTIRANVERISIVVSELSDSAKIEAGRLRLDFKPVDMPDIVNEVVNSTKRQVEDKQQNVEVNLPSQLPQVWADRLRIGQVLTNLVSNAHKYSPEGGKILVGAEVTRNPWNPEGGEQAVHFWVKDDGIGISAEDQAKIFQQFFRSDDPRAREAAGTGLGLNITKSLVEMMGGRIWFDSEYRKGTTFHFTIPVAEE